MDVRPLTNRIGQSLRQRRVGPLIEMIQTVHRERGCVSIIDLGGTERYWSTMPAGFLNAHSVSIVCANPFKRPDDHGCFRFTQDDACALPFADRSFDIAHSNSVIEHVGDWMRMKAFAAEARRVAQRYWIQTPNFWFPIEPHCMTPAFHWLPVPMRAWLLMRSRLGHFQRAATYDAAMQTIESARLLNRKMMRELFPDSVIRAERLAGLSKSLIAVRQ